MQKEFVQGKAQAYRVALLSLVLILLVAAGGEEARALFRYDRAAVLSGQWWRLLTAHWVHLGVPHLLMNVGALIIIGFISAPLVSERRQLAVLLWCAPLIALGFLLSPSTQWYVGYSALLHSLLLTSSVLGLRRYRLESVLLLAAMAGKLSYEQLLGPLPASTTLAHGPVLLDSHLYGALSALPLALFFLWQDWRHQPPAGSR